MSSLCLYFILLFYSYSSFAKCRGFEDYKPSYCVKVSIKSELKKYDDECIFQYDLIAVRPTEPLKREYPYWWKAFENEGSPHYMRVDKIQCGEIQRSNKTELTGILSQICYDTISFEREFWEWLKNIAGKKTVKPAFEFGQKGKVQFHDKGEVEVYCPEDFL